MCLRDLFVRRLARRRRIARGAARARPALRVCGRARPKSNGSRFIMARGDKAMWQAALYRRAGSRRACRAWPYIRRPVA